MIIRGSNRRFEDIEKGVGIRLEAVEGNELVAQGSHYLIQRINRV